MARNEFSGIDDESYSDGHDDGLEDAATVCEEIAVGSKLTTGERELLVIAASRIRARKAT